MAEYLDGSDALSARLPWPKPKGWSPHHVFLLVVVHFHTMVNKNT